MKSSRTLLQSFSTQCWSHASSWWCQSTSSPRCTSCTRPTDKPWECQWSSTLTSPFSSVSWSGSVIGEGSNSMTTQMITLTTMRPSLLQSTSWWMWCGTSIWTRTDSTSCLQSLLSLHGLNCSFTSGSPRHLDQCSEFSNRCLWIWASSLPFGSLS